MSNTTRCTTLPPLNLPAITTSENTNETASLDLTNDHSLVGAQARNSQDKTLPSYPRQKIVRLWNYEFLCCGLALCTLGGLAATAITYDNKTIPQWRYGLSINTFIAIFTTIIKASVALVITEGLSHLKWTMMREPWPLSHLSLFDEASRGPWGSARLLGHVGYKLRYLVPSIGALTSIILLPIDPFTQQLIRYQDCSRISPAADPLYANVPRTQVFRNSNEDEIYLDGDLSRRVTAAAMEGLYATNKPMVTPHCNGGNCTFSEEYFSVGFCSSCSDVSDKILRMQYEIPFTEQGGERFMNVTQDTFQGTYQNVTVGSILIQDQNGDIYDWANLTHLSMTGDGWNKEGFHIEDTDDVNRIPPVIIIQRRYAAGRRAKYVGWDDAYELQWYSTAASCVVRPCIRGYRARVSESRFQEEASFSTEADMGHSPEDLAMVDLDCKAALQIEQDRAVLNQLGYDTSTTSRWLPYNSSFKIPGVTYSPLYPGDWITSPIPMSSMLPNTMNLYEEVKPWLDINPCGDNNSICMIPKSQVLESVIPKQCVYQISTGLVAMVNNIWFRHFSGTLEGLSERFIGSPQLLAIFDAGSGNAKFEDIQDLFKNITESITTYVRVNGHPDYSQSAAGYVETLNTCIEIRWAWLSYIAVLIAIFLPFFGLLIMKSQKQQGLLAHNFKSSILPVLFHGLGKEALETTNPRAKSNRTEDLDNIAKQLYVSLVPMPRGYQIDVQHGSSKED